MWFHGGVIAHKGSRHWDELLQSDGAKVWIKAAASEQEDEGSDITDEGSDDRQAVQSDEVEEDKEQDTEGDVEETDEEENHDLVNVMDNEDAIIPDNDETLDDPILIQEGYGAL